MAIQYWPYTNIHNLNLDWILTQIKEFGTRLDNAEAHYPKYMGIWDNVQNYPVNSIVQYNDSLYIAIADVPSGVSILDSAYWLQIVEMLPDITGLEAEIESLRGNIIVTPQMYGAAGDGVADDTEAIKTALANCKGLIWFPRGTYRTSSRITFPANTTAIMYGAVLSNPNKEVSAYEIAYSHTHLYGFTYTDNEKYGRNDYNTSALLIHSLSTHPVTDIKVEDAYIYNTKRYAINMGSYKVDYQVVHKCSDILIASCIIDNVWVGIKQSHTYDVRIENCTISNTQAECITLDDGTEYCSIVNCKLMYTNGGIGCIGADDSNNATIRDCKIFQHNKDTYEGARGVGLNQHTGTNRNMEIHNCRFADCSFAIHAKNEAGYSAPAINSLVIADCYFVANTIDIQLDTLDGRGKFVGNEHRNSNANTWLVVEPSLISQFARLYNACEPLTIDLTQYFGANIIAPATVINNANTGTIRNGKMHITSQFVCTTTRTINQTILSIPIAAQRLPVQVCYGITNTGEIVAFISNSSTTALVIRGYTGYPGASDDSIIFTIDANFDICTYSVG